MQIPISKTVTDSVLVAASDATVKERNHADYLCDGSADDVQIQAAIDSLPTIGGVIKLSSGNFNIASTINYTKNNIRIVGREIHTTTLKMANGADTDMFNMSTFNWSHLMDFFADGNKNNNSSGSFCLSNPQNGDCRWTRFFAAYFAEHGLVLTKTWGAVITDVIVEFCGLDGIRIPGDVGTNHNPKFMGCKLMANGRHGIYLGNGTGQAQIMSCELRGGQGGSGIYMYGSDNNLITNCRLTDVEDQAGAIAMHRAGSAGSPSSGNTIVGNFFASGVTTRTVTCNTVLGSSTFTGTAGLADISVGSILVFDHGFPTALEYIVTDITGDQVSILQMNWTPYNAVATYNGAIATVQRIGIVNGSGSVDNIIKDNYIYGVVAGHYEWPIYSGTGHQLNNNGDFKVQSHGVGTIASGDSNVTISHGLWTTPDFVIAVGRHIETSGLVVTSITGNQITVATGDGSTVTADRTFSWEARITTNVNLI